MSTGKTSRLTEAVADYDRALAVLDKLPRHNADRRVQTADVLMNRGIALHENGPV